jgi:sugar phosphate permease
MNANEQQSTVFKRNRILTVFLVTLCLISQSVTLFGIAIFLPEIRKDLGLSFTQGGALSAASLLTYALMQIPAGFLADRFGYKRIFFTGALATTVLCLTFGFISNYWQGITVQAFSGFSCALLFAPGLALVASWFSSERRATAMSLSSAGLFLGQVLISWLGPQLAVGSSWRFPFIVFASAGIVISFVYLWLGKESTAPATQQRVNLLEVFELFRRRTMWLVGALQYVRFAIFQGIAIWLPSLLIEEKGVALQVTGLIVAVRALLGIPSNILGAYVSDRLRNPILVIGLSLIILSITTALFVRVDNMALLITLIMVNAFFVQFYFGPLFAMPVDVLGKHMTGTATGFGNFFANLGSFTFVYLLGVLRDASGSFASGFYAIAGICIVGLVFTILLARIRHKSVPATG